MSALGHRIVELGIAAGVIPALGPAPQVGFLLQLVGLGGVIGSVLALRMRRRDPHADAWAITTAWSTLALGVGIIVLTIHALA